MLRRLPPGTAAARLDPVRLLLAVLMALSTALLLPAIGQATRPTASYIYDARAATLTDSAVSGALEHDSSVSPRQAYLYDDPAEVSLGKHDLIRGFEATDSSIGVFRTAEGASGAPGISLDEARAAAERNGIDTRSFDLNCEPGGPGQYGYTSYNGAGQLLRGANGRFQVTLTDLGLNSGEDAINTIAHELNHIRESLATGTFPVSEDPAITAGDMAEWNYVP